jgi:LysR family transcriptional regulator, glycine cleavage system transcriptional activator
MIAPRRFLPSMSLLAAFEAAARTESVSTAAEELNLTQSAVSRQIKALEDQLGASLFAREKQRMRLTSAGRAYADEIRDALRKIRTASLTLSANPSGGVINLAILPTFGTRWLAPRLPKFFSANPGITINLATRLSYFDFRVERFDAAIQVGSANWPGVETVPLFRETVVAACSPRLKEIHRLKDPKDLKQCTLLHIATRPSAWEKWFEANGISATGLQGMFFDQIATISQAAIAGVGVALLPNFLIKDELAAQTLVPAVDILVKSEEGYFLAWPSERASYPPLVAFREWLVEEARSATRE